MSKPSKRLEYDSLKAVLQHINPNLRIKLRCHIPSIRTIEKVIPFKIKYLTSGGAVTTINDTSYKVGVYRKYDNPAEIPRLHQKHNDDGGFACDLDQWGFRKSFMDLPLTEGDVDLRPARDIFHMLEQSGPDYKERQLVTAEEALGRLTGVRRKPELVEPSKAIMIILQNERWIQDIMKRTVDQIEKTIEKSRTSLLPFYYRRNNIPAPFTQFIQLTVNSSNGTFIERVECSKLLCEAMKYINTVLFGNRSLPINVSEISFKMYRMLHCLPPDMKVKTAVMQSGMFDYGKLQNVMLTSYPLETLRIGISTIDHIDFRQDVITSAKKLVISGYYEMNRWGPFLRTLKNQEIVLQRQYQINNLLEYVDLIGNWLEDFRSRGSSFIIGFKRLEHVTRILEQAETRFEAIRRNERVLTIPMRNGSRLEVSCIEFEEGPDDMEANIRAGMDALNENSKSEWALKLVVV